MSEVPFAGPVSAVCVGFINNEFVLNPTLVQLENSQLDLVVASTREAIVMVEAGAQEISEDIVVKAMEFGHEANQNIISIQEQLQQAAGKPKQQVAANAVNPEITSAISPIIDGRLETALFQTEKVEREAALSELRNELIDKLGEKFSKEDILSAFDQAVRTAIRTNILENGRRVSKRSLAEIRPVSCEAGLLPRTHGSALFSRGRTQILTITTLGSTRKEQQLDGLGIEETKRFMHHYNFTPFSTGEVKRVGTPGRREIGHGALAERALLSVIPSDEDFPYTIRLVSEVLSSSGSTSMASVCASSLSLMDAGVPTKKAVAGIAMGVVIGDDGKFAILTDIEGIEDNHGDMDFKIAGTAEGITALQMDTKLKGLNPEILERALDQAKDARLSILEVMNQTISTSRPEVSRYAPRMHKIKIDTDKIGALIGPGGKTIRTISEETQTTIDVDNDGNVVVGSLDEEAARKAIEIIEGLTKEVEVGAIYTGKVTRLLAFGAFVEILPRTEGMVHISELAPYRVASIEDEVKVGDEITVQVIRNEDGKIALSRKAVFDKSSDSPSADRRETQSTDQQFRKGRDSHPPRRPPNAPRKRY